jgi:hypothetical protein
MATKKNEKAALAEFKLQALAGLAIAKTMLAEVFGEGAATASDTTRVVEWLEWEENGDPAEDQSELLGALREAKEHAHELHGAAVSIEGVLDVHETIYQDFYDEE